MEGGNQIRRRRGIIACVLFAVLTGGSVVAEEAAAILGPADGTPVSQCPPNEYYRRCISNCNNCEQRGLCQFECTQSGCDCNPRYVRLIPGGPCEPVSKCPIPTCGENEIFRPCGPICERCGTLRCQVITCDFKCYCKQGFLRNAEGQCIPEDDCPPRTQCTSGEMTGTSGPVDEYCLHDDDHVASNATVEKEGCYCQDGFKRNQMGHCTEFCQFTMCRNGEKYSSCPRKCDTTCHNYGDPTCEEDGQCFPGCFCPEGTVLNHRTCVRPEKCPPGSNSLAPTVAPTTPDLQTKTSSIITTITSPMPTTESATIAATTKAEDTPTDGKGDDDDESQITTASDFSTEASDTTQKPKHGKRGKILSHANAEAKAEASKTPTKSPPKTKLVTPDEEDENE